MISSILAYTVLRWEEDFWRVEIRRHSDGKFTAHYKGYGEERYDGEGYEYPGDASEKSLRLIAAKCFPIGGERADDFAKEMQEARKKLEGTNDPRHHGTYIGPELRFRGRTANLVVFSEHVMAQFDVGELWEMHSHLNFPIEHWEIEDAASGM